MIPDGVAARFDDDIGYRRNPRPEMLPFLPASERSLRVLEIGCGDGTFASSIANAGEVWGVEPYEPSARIAAQRLFKCFACTFDAAKSELPRHYFDLVVCNDVIEHMTDHDGFLASIQDHMAPGGALMGSLPNVRYYKNLFKLICERDWEYQDSGILDRTHFRFFTMKSLRRSLERAGFVVERLEGINSGFQLGWQPWMFVYYGFFLALAVLSGGHARDSFYVQIAFRAVPAAGKPAGVSMELPV